MAGKLNLQRRVVSLTSPYKDNESAPIEQLLVCITRYDDPDFSVGGNGRSLRQIKSTMIAYISRVIEIRWRGSKKM